MSHLDGFKLATFIFNRWKMVVHNFFLAQIIMYGNS